MPLQETRQRPGLQACALALCLALAACGGGDGAEASPPAPDDGASDGTARACFDPDMYREGARIIQNYVLDGDPAGNRFQNLSMENLPPAPFAGALRPSQQVDQTLRNEHSVTAHMVSRHYREVDLASGEILNYGFEVGPMSTVIDGGCPDQRFALRPGEVDARDCTLDTGGTSRVARYTTKFVGIEEVATYGGRFSACRFEEEVSMDGIRVSSAINWIAQGMSVMNQVSQPDGRPPVTYELSRAELNDVLLTTPPR